MLRLYKVILVDCCWGFMKVCMRARVFVRSLIAVMVTTVLPMLLDLIKISILCCS